MCAKNIKKVSIKRGYLHGWRVEQNSQGGREKGTQNNSIVARLSFPIDFAMPAISTERDKDIVLTL